MSVVGKTIGRSAWAAGGPGQALGAEQLSSSSVVVPSSPAAVLLGPTSCSLVCFRRKEPATRVLQRPHTAIVVRSGRVTPSRPSALATFQRSGDDSHLPTRLPLRLFRLTSSSPLQVVRSPPLSFPSSLLLYDPPLPCTSNHWLPTPDSCCFSSRPSSRSRDDPEDKCAHRIHLRRFSASSRRLRRPRIMGHMVWTQVSPSCICISVPAIADSTQ